MKAKYLLATLPLLGLAFTGCNDLNVAPEGSTITQGQKDEVVKNDPEMQRTMVAAIPATLKQRNGVTNDTKYQQDFGWGSVMLATDSRSEDMVSEDIGYNWFSASLTYTDQWKNYVANLINWGSMFKIVQNSNTLLKTFDKESEDPTTKFYLAQAYGYRAFGYFAMVQLYQYTYVGHQEAPAVPLITEANVDEAAANGCPRATVQEIYDQVLSDLDKAITLLEETKNIKPADRDSKKYFYAAAAHALRARVYLVMNDWTKAAADAQYAIDNSGAQCYSRAEVSKPTFWNAADNSWILATIIDETDPVVVSRLCNWPAHIGSLNYGYGSVGAWKRINAKLYSEIPPSDVRKGWWLDQSGNSVNLNKDQKAFIDNAISDIDDPDISTSPAYINVKFGPYADIVENTMNANDLPMIRVEEMYLILAEAQAMGGDPAQGAATLGQWVRTYRNPEYVNPTGSATEIQDAVYFQRRIELWGEGMAYFDLMRRNKGVNRNGGGFASSVDFVFGPEDPALIYQIPQKEEDNNPLLGGNNPAAKL